MRVIALLATYNEERFIADCIEHLATNGVDVYVVDNESTDRTVELARQRLGRGVIGVESFPRDGVYRWRALLERKERLAQELDADWFMHLDADEVRLPPVGAPTLADAFAEEEARGYNAVNFNEFTFLPTREEPDHDHPRYRETMRWYYPYKTASLHGLKAWRRPPAGKPRRGLARLDRRGDVARLAWSGGHRVRFAGLRVSPTPFRMRHYLFLSPAHAVEKYVRRAYDETEVRAGWHQWRARLTAETVRLPSASELRLYRSDDGLDPRDPRRTHYVAGRL